MYISNTHLNKEQVKLQVFEAKEKKFPIETMESRHIKIFKDLSASFDKKNN